MRMMGARMIQGPMKMTIEMKSARRGFAWTRLTKSGGIETLPEIVERTDCAQRVEHCREPDHQLKCKQAFASGTPWLMRISSGDAAYQHRYYYEANDPLVLIKHLENHWKAFSAAFRYENGRKLIVSVGRTTSIVFEDIDEDVAWTSFAKTRRTSGKESLLMTLVAILIHFKICSQVLLESKSCWVAVRATRYIVCAG